MRSAVSFSSLGSLERLEVKLSPTSQSVSSILATSVTSTPVPADDGDPPPQPEPPLPPYPGDNPPLDPP